MSWTGVASIAALIFSAVSLYETVLKQADLRLFAPEAIAYTRDSESGFEVFAVPLTLTNAGARDGVVTAMRLRARNVETGRERLFHASFFAELGYFSSADDFAAGATRPKTPFAPLSAPGRASLTRTVLFYPRERSDDRVTPGAGLYEFELEARTDALETLGPLDRLWSAPPPQLRFRAELPVVSRFFGAQMLEGRSARLFVVEAD